MTSVFPFSEIDDQTAHIKYKVYDINGSLQAPVDIIYFVFNMCGLVVNFAKGKDRGHYKLPGQECVAFQAGAQRVG
jgi:hypothetical protein